MKLTKILGVVAAAAMALMAFASTASATTLEVGGVKQPGPVTIHATLESGSSAILKDTAGAFANTCTESTVEGHTESPYTAAGTNPIGGPITTLTFSKCTEEPVVVDLPGRLTVSWIKGTTNGTIRSIGAKVTSPSPFGALTCVTATSPGTDIGTLTGKPLSSEHATIDINAVLNCGFFLPSAKWEGTYTATSPTGLAVTE
ncbi:MAG TPA: hypothetical protein VGW80_09965 [Solirubrobacterales bacterium]|jgi:hypothetical protein|nr:hypothetical protein [Solirubrobacterales bacterium]